MAVTYYRRYTMEIELGDWLAEPELPDGYRWIAWRESLLAVHAQVKFHCFVGELDSNVFPCLGDLAGCRQLMRAIRRNRGFLPDATWLVAYGRQMCGTIQGILEPSRVGVIQNLGVVPAHRGRGLGRALLIKALLGFYQHGAKRAKLEVTADNEPAVKLYEAVGFRKARVVYRASDR